ncbi:Disease resistance protein [Quillaja saponaria]|uniref:Disease resistance protein n=1 Tax=Quillaja saponaria TaxID=32244 RepID=A0AAD7P5L2_QUISA|nr:Disease resistance protein [Quillaja saponaria]
MCTRLHERLKQEKNVLVILDDLWEGIHLRKIGIPFGGDRKGCKVLLTSRSQEVLSNQMVTRKDFLLGVLPEEEALELFKEMAGLDEDLMENSELLFTATEVAEKCAGLPIALVTIGKALRNKSLFEWRDALRQLKRPTFRNISQMKEVVDSSIKLSFDYLESEELKNIFLLSATEMDYTISFTEMLKYSVELRLFRDIYTIEAARDRLHALINKLKATCLLQDGYSSDRFTMHDVVRDVAMTIASNLHHAFVMRFDKLNDWPEKDQLRIYTSISLRLRDIGRLPEVASCKQLTQLQLLDLGNCSKLEVIPPNVLSNFIKLEELNMENSFSGLESEEANSKEINANLIELNCLPELNTLDIRIRDPSAMPMDLFKKLERYKILIGDVWNWFGNYKTSRTLKLKINMSFHLVQGIQRLLERVEDLHLDELSSVKNVLYELNQEGFPYLKHLLIQNNADIEYIVNSMDLELFHPGKAFPVLESLIIHNLIKLENICIGLLSVESFSKLQVIKVKSCHKLKNLFTFSMVRSLSRLFEIEVSECNFIQEIVTLRREDCIDNLHSHKLEFHQLHSLTLQNLTALFHFDMKTSFHMENDYAACMPLFCEKALFPNLKTLVITNMNNLETIWSVDHVTPNSFGKLKLLKIQCCMKLQTVVPSHMLRKPQNLEILTVGDCSSLKEIFRLDAGDEAHGNHVVTQLKNLSLDRLSKLKHIWNRDPEGIFSFQTLQVVKVNECEMLENIFPASVAKYLQLLEELDIRFCAILETIVAKEETIKATIRVAFPQLFSLTLGHLSKLKNFYPGPGVQTIECPQLKRLDASNCHELDLGMEYQTSRATHEVDRQDVEIKQPVFLIEKAIPNLETMSLNNKDTLRLLNGQSSSTTRFRKQKVLVLSFLDNEEAVNFPYRLLLRSVPTVEELGLVSISLKEIFPSGRQMEIQEQGTTIMHLKRLLLARLPNLENICGEGSELDPLLEKLETLCVWECSSLIKLVPSTVSFKNLAVLEIKNCGKLVNLLAPSTAKSLAQLTILRIVECKILEEVITNDEDEDEIEFRHLQFLVLLYLPELIRFSSANWALKFAQLTDAIVKGCPKMEVFLMDF